MTVRPRAIAIDKAFTDRESSRRTYSCQRGAGNGTKVSLLSFS